MEINEEMKQSKKKPIEPIIAYKEVHGQLVPVKIYPTPPLTDTFDNLSTEELQSKSIFFNDYYLSKEVEDSIEHEYHLRLN